MNATITQKIEKAQAYAAHWKTTTIDERIEVIRRVEELLKKNKQQYAEAITKDMHKPISQALAEVEKCAYLCAYYATIAHQEMQPKIISSPWSKSEARLEPLGVVLGIMPWNFPFWQVMRFVIPSILVGNVVLMKHASNVPLSAACLEQLFKKATDNSALYQDLPISGSETTEVIAHPVIQAVSFTGSEPVGRLVAEQAGKYLKKCVLELGGSNAFIVCKDVEVSSIIEKAVWARMQNAGQSCIAAKRFLVHESLVDSFTQAFVEQMNQLKTGDAFSQETTFGSMAKESLAEELEEQLRQSVAQGAKIIAGGHRSGAYFEPTLLTQVTSEMPVFQEETFGPLAVIVPFKDFDEAVALSNATRFGLGVSIFTNKPEEIENQLCKFDEGAVFINEMVTSDPNLPFGGVKDSGYGRELSPFALYEFANLKTIVYL